MGYLERLSEKLKETSKLPCRIAKHIKCKTITGGSYYAALMTLIKAVILYLFWFLFLFTFFYDSSMPLKRNFIVLSLTGGIMSCFFYIAFLPYFICLIVQTVKMRALILKGDLTVGLIIGCKLIGTYKGRNKHEIEYCYLNGRGSMETSIIKANSNKQFNLPMERKVLIAYNDNSSIILSGFMLEGVPKGEPAGIETEREFEGLTNVLIDSQAQEKDIVGYHKGEIKSAKFVIGFGALLTVILCALYIFVGIFGNVDIDVVNPVFGWIVAGLFLPGWGLIIVAIGITLLTVFKRKKEHERKILSCAKITKAKIITSDIYEEKSEGIVYYCFIDREGVRHICKQQTGRNCKLPAKPWAAYNPDNPEESLLIHGRNIED